MVTHEALEKMVVRIDETRVDKVPCGIDDGGVCRDFAFRHIAGDFSDNVIAY